VHEQLLLSQEGAGVSDPTSERSAPRGAAPLVAVVTNAAPPSEALAGASLVVRVAPYAARAAAREARIGVAIADPARAQAVAAAVAEAIRAAGASAAPDRAARTVRLRSRKRLARIAGELTGAIAIVPVTARNARHLVALVEGVRAAGAIGVQLVWDGELPPRAEVEPHVFAALERARATPDQPPVVLATSDRPVPALHLLVAHRTPSTRRDEPR
jgi:hypothetical protein